MRKRFAEEIYRHMQTNKDIWVIVGDLGYGIWDKVRNEFPDRFINTGAAEQAMVGIACGLALEGKIPIVYSITPFLLYRPFETIRNYVDHEKIPVRLIGSGRGQDYHNEGFSHWATEDEVIMKKVFKNIQVGYPEYEDDIVPLVDTMLKYKKPYYINLRR